MQYRYIVIDDTGFGKQHGEQFETVQQAFDFVNQHRLGVTHLVYDLKSAGVVHPK